MTLSLPFQEEFWNMNSIFVKTFLLELFTDPNIFKKLINSAAILKCYQLILAQTIKYFFLKHSDLEVQIINLKFGSILDMLSVKQFTALH